MSSNADGAKKEKITLLNPGTNRGTEQSTELAQGAAPDRRHGIAGNDVHVGSVGPNGVEPGQSAFEMTADESQRFLRIISNIARIRHHYELFLLLQGEIQHFISHQILIAAWGDFRDSNPTFDIVSALPRVRTHEIGGCGAEVERMLKDVHAYWVANGRREILFNHANFKSIASSTCGCALHKSMRRMQSILVHGIRNERDQTDSLYVAMDPDSVTNGRSIKRFLALVDPLLTQIDVAFQKIGALKSTDVTARVDDASSPGDLTKREREVMKWIAEGRTNVEIGAILGISSCTVKIHLHTILLKLGASNRTEAVFKFKEYGSRK